MNPCCIVAKDHEVNRMGCLTQSSGNVIKHVGSNVTRVWPSAQSESSTWHALLVGASSGTNCRREYHSSHHFSQPDQSSRHTKKTLVMYLGINPRAFYRLTQDWKTHPQGRLRILAGALVIPLRILTTLAVLDAQLPLRHESRSSQTPLIWKYCASVCLLPVRILHPTRGAPS